MCPVNDEANFAGSHLVATDGNVQTQQPTCIINEADDYV